MLRLGRRLGTKMSVSEYLKFKNEAKESIYQAFYSEGINTSWKLQVSTLESHIVAYYRSIHKKKFTLYT